MMAFVHDSASTGEPIAANHITTITEVAIIFFAMFWF
jgi:hypothetical protein